MLHATVTGIPFFILLLFFFYRLRAEYENHQPKHLKKRSRMFVLFFPKKCLCVCIGRVFTEDEENPTRSTMYKPARGWRRCLWYSIDISL